VLIRVPATRHGVSTCVEASKLNDPIEVPRTTIGSPAMKSPIVAASPPSLQIVNIPVPPVNGRGRCFVRSLHRFARQIGDPTSQSQFADRPQAR
jgi:hypothetical protein